MSVLINLTKKEISMSLSTEAKLFKALKSIPEKTRGWHFKFNPRPLRSEESLTGNISRKVVLAARIAEERANDNSFTHFEIKDILAEGGIKMTAAQVYATLMNLADPNEKNRTASTIFIKFIP